jgi:small subunit ribosomal protein S24e
MELRITSDKENRMLNRREIGFTVSQDNSTMSRNDITKEICKKLNLDPGSTIIVRIDQGFGAKESSGIAHSYENADALKRYEPEHLLARIAKKSSKQEPAADKGQKEEKAEQKEKEETVKEEKTE